MKIQRSLTEASKLTPEEKMDAWHAGARKENIKACGDDKLKEYFEICGVKQYLNEYNSILAEAQKRGLPWIKPDRLEILKYISFAKHNFDFINTPWVFPQGAVETALHRDISDTVRLLVGYLIISIILNKQEHIEALRDELLKIISLDELKKLISEVCQVPEIKQTLADIYNELNKEEISEDLEKKINGKWVNKGESEHGEFKTKKAARQQQKAMFANGFTESLDEDFSRNELIANIKKLGYNYNFSKYTDAALWNILQWAKKQPRKTLSDTSKAARKQCPNCGTNLNDFDECPVCDLGDESALDEDIEKHDELNPKLFENGKLKSEVKEKVLQIVDEFAENLEEDEIKFDIDDVILVGSNCSYNYNKDSDLDIHIVVNTDSLDCPDNLYPKLYSAYRSLFNKNLDIDFYGIPVELYVQTDETPMTSNGIYSVIKDDWIKEPVQEDIPEIDMNEFEKEFKVWEDRYNNIMNNSNNELNEVLHITDDNVVWRAVRDAIIEAADQLDLKLEKNQWEFMADTIVDNLHLKMTKKK